MFVQRHLCAGLVAQQHGGSPAAALVVQPVGGYPWTEWLPIECLTQRAHTLDETGKHGRTGGRRHSVASRRALSGELRRVGFGCGISPRSNRWRESEPVVLDPTQGEHEPGGE